MLTKRTRSRVKLLDEPGEFEAVFCTMRVIDLDLDVIELGAIGEQPVKIAHWGHRHSELPVGRGVAFERANEGIVQGRLFLDTTAGRETHATLRGLGDLCEWSFAYKILKSRRGKMDGQDVRFLSKLKILEVSPVFAGAGVATRTTILKAQGRGMTPTSALAQIGDLAGQPALVRAAIDKQLADDGPAGGPPGVAGQRRPTRFEVIYDLLGRENPGSSAAWLQIMAESAVLGVADRFFADLELIGGAVPYYREAWDRAMAWALQPA